MDGRSPGGDSRPSFRSNWIPPASCSASGELLQPRFLLRSPASEDLNACDVIDSDVAMGDAEPYVSLVQQEMQRRGLRIDAESGATIGVKRRASREPISPPGTPGRTWRRTCSRSCGAA